MNEFLSTKRISWAMDLLRKTKNRIIVHKRKETWHPLVIKKRKNHKGRVYCDHKERRWLETGHGRLKNGSGTNHFPVFCGWFFIWSRIERKRDKSFVALADLGLNSHRRVTRSHSCPGWVDSRSDVWSFSSCLQKRERFNETDGMSYIPNYFFFKLSSLVTVLLL